MLVYRFRPMSQLSIKELMYDEFYFSYSSELNDPLDGQVNYEFGEDYPKWKCLIDHAWAGLSIDATSVANALSKASQIPVKTLTAPSQFLFEIIYRHVKKTPIDLTYDLMGKLTDLIKNAHPGDGCSVSFSGTYDNALMWSHYTYKHEGFCVIYRSINGGIAQCPERFKGSLDLESGSLVLPQSFEIKEINYNSNNLSIDGFTLFPISVFGRDFSIEESNLHHSSIEKILLSKSPCWDYEKEKRIFIHPCPPQVSREKLSPFQRIIHYDNSQIAGVIFGMRMSPDNKRLVREILLSKSKERFRSSDHEKFIFNIVSFNAKFEKNSHAMRIEPEEIFDCGKAIDKTHNLFSKNFGAWKNGRALHIEPGGKGSQVTLD